MPQNTPSTAPLGTPEHGEKPVELTVEQRLNELKEKLDALGAGEFKKTMSRAMQIACALYEMSGGLPENDPRKAEAVTVLNHIVEAAFAQRELKAKLGEDVSGEVKRETRLSLMKNVLPGGDFDQAYVDGLVMYKKLDAVPNKVA